MLQSSIQDLDSAVSDPMDVSFEKCAEPLNSDLPSDVGVKQSGNGSSEHLGSAVIKGATGNEGYSGIASSEQTDDGKFVVVDVCINFTEHLAVEFGRFPSIELGMQCTNNGSMNSECTGDEGSLVNVENSADQKEIQEKIPMEEPAMSDGTSITSTEDALEPNNDLPSEPEDMSNHTPDPSNGKSSKGNRNVFQSAKRVLTSTAKVCNCISICNILFMYDSLFI